jgi:hypothetical protein
METDVNVPATGVVAPIIMLSILPVTAGLIVTVPVPVGLIVTLPFAGLSVTDCVAERLVKVPAAGVRLPIVILSNVLADVGFNINEDVTVKFCTLKLVVLRFKDIVLVAVFVTKLNAPLVTIFKVLLFGLNAIVPFPEDAMYVYPFIKLLQIVV